MIQQFMNRKMQFLIVTEKIALFKTKLYNSIKQFLINSRNYQKIYIRQPIIIYVRQLKNIEMVLNQI